MLGNYWVDPDAGCKKNAILASCKFEFKETCIKPKESYIEHHSGEQVKWSKI